MTKDKTTVRQMFDAYVAGNWQTMNWTREKTAHAWDDFWTLLVMSGFYFEKDVLMLLRKYCSKSKYNPRWHSPQESHYSLAVRAGNLTFAYAYEKLVARTPFIGIGLDYSGCWPEFSNHATQEKSAGRLVVGVRFLWQGETAGVTTFNDEKKSLIACAYHPDPDGYRPSKIKKRFAITADAFRLQMSQTRAAIAKATN